MICCEDTIHINRAVRIRPVETNLFDIFHVAGHVLKSKRLQALFVRVRQVDKLFRTAYSYLVFPSEIASPLRTGIRINSRNPIVDMVIIDRSFPRPRHSPSIVHYYTVVRTTYMNY